MYYFEILFNFNQQLYFTKIILSEIKVHPNAHQRV